MRIKTRFSKHCSNAYSDAFAWIDWRGRRLVHMHASVGKRQNDVSESAANVYTDARATRKISSTRTHRIKCPLPREAIISSRGTKRIALARGNVRALSNSAIRYSEGHQADSAYAHRGVCCYSQKRTLIVDYPTSTDGKLFGLSHEKILVTLKYKLEELRDSL